MKIRKQTTSPAKKILITLAIVMVLAIPGYLVVAKYNKLWPFQATVSQTSNESSTESDRPVNSVDYSPPTDNYIEQQQKEKEQRLKEAEERQKEQSSNASTKKQALINISFADIYNNNLEVRAFITNVIEGTGKCTLTASRTGFSPVTVSTPAFVDATSSICQPLYIPKNKLAPGTWNIVVSYSSPTYEGKTNSSEVEVK